MSVAEDLLVCCLRGERWPASLLAGLAGQAASPDPAVAQPATSALFGTLIEGLSDRFDPRLCDTYAELFAAIVARVYPETKPEDLVTRYQRVRRPRRLETAGVRKVFVLSRITLGADVAITSVMLDAAKRRLPDAEIYLAGSRKVWELFAADARIRHLEIPYGRGATLRDRLAIWPLLRAALYEPGAVVLDPDSRLTQLGMLPVCPEENYYFFESRGYGGDGSDSLATLARRWCAETLGVADAAPYIAPLPIGEPFPAGPIAISLGVGENLAKRLPDPFEERLIRALLSRGVHLVIDKGAPGEEMDRVNRILSLCADFSQRIHPWEGPFAPFAARIAAARFYTGYDSAGQHVAAASGVPLAAIFSGFATERTIERWRPTGRAPATIIRADRLAPDQVIDAVLAAAFA